MPGVALHLEVATSALDALMGSTRDLPFDPTSDVHLNAYYHGAIGPDLGYFPGCYRTLSDLSHCVRTGLLTKTILRLAQTPEQKAFAWGWLTHVLADRHVHPLIGRGVGEIVEGCRHTFVDGSSHPLEHLQIEMGVDAWFAVRSETIRDVRLAPAFDDRTIGFLARAYAATYGVAIPTSRFLASHRHAGLRASQGLASIGWIGALMEEDEASVLLWSVRWLLKRAYSAAPLRGVSLAYLNPVRPSAWLLDEVRETIAGLPDTIICEWISGAASLEDRNLDTGRHTLAESEHPGTIRALQALSRLMNEHGPDTGSRVGTAVDTRRHGTAIGA